MNSNIWCFILGREPLLSAAELKAVFEMSDIVGNTSLHILPAEKRGESELKYLLLDTNDKFDFSSLMNRLGGTIKICKKTDCEKTIESIGHFLNSYIKAGKIIFSISGETDQVTGLNIKKFLKKTGRPVRFVEPKNTATIIHNRLIEKGADLQILPEGVFVTKAIQPIESFGERDFGRPGRDDLSGMLPPKLAMIMINLSKIPLHGTLADLFCGSGTMITEAVLMGYTNIIGSDISEKAIVDTRKNVEWIVNKHPEYASTSIKLFQEDAAKISDKIAANSVDAIVTEPYLGRPLHGNEPVDQLKKQAEELKTIYTSAFEQFAKILKPGGTAVLVVPRFRHGNDWVKINFLSEIKHLGFRPTTLWDKHQSLLYCRPQQFVGREIWRFELAP